MPLKHHTETAYLVFLGIAVCVTGIVLSLLPALPEGLVYWGAGFVVALLYPLVLRKTFRKNRADYEFRLLHWFPVGMFLLWMLMQLTDPVLHVFHILNLGFFYLWSFPLVALGLFFISVFAAHVLRRRTQRIGFMVVIAALFMATAVFAETININPELSRTLFPTDGTKNGHTIAQLVDTTSKRVNRWIEKQNKRMLEANRDSSPIRPPIAAVSSSVSKQSSSSSVRTIEPIAVASSSSVAPTITKPDQLAGSGPEGIVVLGLTLLALYAGTLHRRARARV